MSNQMFKKLGTLIHFIWRRDRIRLFIWIAAITATTLGTASSFSGLYVNENERQLLAETMINPAMIAMVGPSTGLDNYTFGAMLAHQMLLFTAITVAIMNILFITRHTRADEEEGNIEMIRSLPTGRLSNLTAVLTVALISNALIMVIIGAGLPLLQIDSIDWNGSILYGAVLGATGFFFAAITTLFAQLSDNAKGTIGFSFTLLIVSYLIRAIGDVSNDTLSAFSPLGIILDTHVFVLNDWWPLAILGMLTVLIALCAVYLHAIRDLGAGFFPTKPGRVHASRWLQSPSGLAIRLQRTGIIAWAIGMYVLGASYGSVLGDLDTFFADNEVMQDFLAPIPGVSLTDQFISLLLTIMAMIGTIPVLLSLLKLKGEESKHRLESMLALPISRYQLLGSYFMIAMLLSIFMNLLAVLGLWSVGNTVLDNGLSLMTLIKSDIVYLPAIWVMVGVAIVLLGTTPKQTGFIWLYLTYSFIVVYMGDLFQFPTWMKKASPFGYVPQMPVEDMRVTPVLSLFVIAIIMMIAGFLFYRKRDLQG
ncbi:ABC transporter permease [Virgibacillus sp. MG-45]|uniref:ABC transporter permease n=1 Tax=Virgibacillus sp. MG-45 TaxID=3102791 RepID=UPI002ED9F1A7